MYKNYRHLCQTLFFVLLSILSNPVSNLLQPGPITKYTKVNTTSISCLYNQTPILKFNTTLRSECALQCNFNKLVKCLRFNFYPQEGRCEIFSVWNQYDLTPWPNGTSRVCEEYGKDGACPPSFDYIPQENVCFRFPAIYFYPLNWDSSRQLCSALSNTSQMLVVDTPSKGIQFKNYINFSRATASSKNGIRFPCLYATNLETFWTAGRRVPLTDFYTFSYTTYAFKWFLSINLTKPLASTAPWAVGQPSGPLDYTTDECIGVSTVNGALRDVLCNTSLCALCETQALY